MRREQLSVWSQLQGSLSAGSSVSKKGGTARPVVNLKPLNRFIFKRLFKIEGTATLRELIREQDWMMSVDLKDAFPSVPIHTTHRNYFASSGRGKCSSFSAFPLGSSVPQEFLQSS